MKTPSDGGFSFMGSKKWIKWWWDHLLGHAATYPVVAVVIAVGTYVFRESDRERLLAYAVTHYWRITITLLLLGSAPLAVKLFSRLRDRLIRASQFQETIEAVGVHSFSLHSSQTRSRDWQRCVDIIRDENPQTVCILGATGWETFGSPQAPLHDFLMAFDGEIKILLIKPDSFAFKRRCMELKRSDVHYAEQISNTLDFCKSLASRWNKNIEVKLYQRQAVWKMIFTNNYLWLQHYDPSRDVDETPVYNFQTQQGPNRTSLYYPFVREYKKIWRDSDTQLFALA